MFETEKQSLCYLPMKDDNVQFNIWQAIENHDYPMIGRAPIREAT